MEIGKPMGRRKLEKLAKMHDSWMNQCIKEIDLRILSPVDLTNR